MSKRAKYYVHTWDTNKQAWTPQQGVRCGPYSLFGLRKALRRLRGMDYDVSRSGGHSVLVQSTEE